MIGIYKITNLVTGTIYIGQSKNIERRFIDHRTPGHNSEIVDKNINLYGRNNFSYEVLEECTLEQLDEREDYYIKLYRQTHKLYNKLDGGQSQGFRCGANNGNAKLTEEDVYNIREAYKNHERRCDTFEKYKDKVSQSTFESLWQGQYWQTVHMDVYTEENKRYYANKTITDEEVMEIRRRYVNESPEQMIKDPAISSKMTLSRLKKIVYGTSYAYLPIYRKTEKKWINKNNT